MGMMRFRVFPAERNTEQLARLTYLSGIDRTSWPVRTAVEGDMLVLHRSVSDSANLHVLWPVEGYGQLALATGCLFHPRCPRKQPRCETEPPPLDTGQGHWVRCFYATG